MAKATPPRGSQPQKQHEPPTPPSRSRPTSILPDAGALAPRQLKTPGRAGRDGKIVVTTRRPRVDRRRSQATRSWCQASAARIRGVLRRLHPLPSPFSVLGAARAAGWPRSPQETRCAWPERRSAPDTALRPWLFTGRNPISQRRWTLTPTAAGAQASAEGRKVAFEHAAATETERQHTRWLVPVSYREVLLLVCGAAGAGGVAQFEPEPDAVQRLSRAWALREQPSGRTDPTSDDDLPPRAGAALPGT